MFRIGVLVSGGGTNLQAIIDRIEDGYLSNCEITSVVSSKEGVFALERAKKHGISARCIARKAYSNTEEYSSALAAHFEQENVDLIVLAGFLTVLSENFIKRFENKIINVHPSLIPSFCGKGFYGLIPHEEALKYGVKVTGATVHFVNGEVDGGKIILQKAVYVQDGDTPEVLQARVMKEAEHIILPEAIKKLSMEK
ncbi:MAG: phosphoribosylglycinamide formyltransferase [Clostridia bacterium]|jgi:phosphoribosylglycinamide formyltransferase-1|nr:phosphoribosylglycinamide formyltransferase [Clostridia bacterium]